jgi:hypothetical protein
MPFKKKKERNEKRRGDANNLIEKQPHSPPEMALDDNCFFFLLLKAIMELDEIGMESVMEQTLPISSVDSMVETLVQVLALETHRIRNRSINITLLCRNNAKVNY